MYRKIIYSYPTSINATRLNREKTGCYAISMTDKATKEIGKLHGPFDTLQEAREALVKLFPDLPTDPYSFGECRHLART